MVELSDALIRAGRALLGVCAACAAMEAVTGDDRLASAFRPVCALAAASTALRVVMRLLKV